VPWGDLLLRYTLPTLLGNVLGGVSLVAALNHAQVVAGDEGNGASERGEAYDGT